MNESSEIRGEPAPHVLSVIRPMTCRANSSADKQRSTPQLSWTHVDEGSGVLGEPAPHVSSVIRPMTNRDISSVNKRRPAPQLSRSHVDDIFLSGAETTDKADEGDVGRKGFAHT